MQAKSANLLSVLKGPRQFVIPIYQRTYSWQIAQCDKLLKDIIRISKDPSVPGHFIGSIVYFQEGIHAVSDVPELLVIDGQQRLTTVSILIAAIADFINENDIEIETTYTKLQNYYLLNAEEEGNLRYKLLLTRRDKETLIDLMKGVPPREEHSQRVIENYNYFKEKITKENAVDIYNGIQRLFIVDVALEKDKDNPQLIFESLNSTGLDLSHADLIRNYILMGQEFALQTELYERFWYPMEQSYGNDYSTYFDWFMRDYLSVKTGKIPTIGMVYESFKNYIQSENAPGTIMEVVKDIHKFSNHYVNMVLHKEPDLELRSAFKSISKLKVDVSYPYFLPIYNDYADGIISKDELLEIIYLIENYVFRRAICGIPTNSMNKTFATLYKSIQKDKYLESVNASFQLLDSYKRFPSDSEFEKEIVTKDVYNFRSRNYLLSKLENHNRKELVNVDNYTIEHILPQNPNLSQDWRTMLGEGWKVVQENFLHTIGNLTLTGYNSELSDRPFSQKKTIEGGFNDSPIRLNDYLRKTDVWNEDEILKRSIELAAKASQIWTSPDLSDEQLEYYKPEEKSTAVYSIDSYDHLKGEMMGLYEALKKRILNIDSSVHEEYKKLYIAYKSSTNFVDIVPQKTRLRLSLNIPFSNVIDPKGYCKDVTDLGRWGNGDVEVGFDNINQLDDVMELIEQAFDKQMEVS
tara:strand:- start:12914 stop:14989 length:2076 start_codon:yes stop_codon:yes gene_type:complete